MNQGLINVPGGRFVVKYIHFVIGYRSYFKRFTPASQLQNASVPVIHCHYMGCKTLLSNEHETLVNARTMPAYNAKQFEY